VRASTSALSPPFRGNTEFGNLYPEHEDVSVDTDFFFSVVDPVISNVDITFAQLPVLSQFGFAVKTQLTGAEANEVRRN